MNNIKPHISVVVPFFNESLNINPLYAELKTALGKLNITYEILFIDDWSTDNTYQVLTDIYAADPAVKLIRLTTHQGQTAALEAGFSIANGEIIVSMDGDLQHDPDEIKDFIAKINEGYSIVSGWRKERTDPFLTRQLPSIVANRLIQAISGVKLHDFGTTFKAYRSSVIKTIDLFGDMHRFIPAIAELRGIPIAEIPIKNRIRVNGQSNYDLSRTVKVITDLIFLRYFSMFICNPLRLFGVLGLISFTSGLSIASILIILYLLEKIGPIRNHIALMLLAILFMIIGIQFITSGIIAELNARIYSKIFDRKKHSIGEVRSHD